MRLQRTTHRGVAVRRLRIAALATGLVAAGAFALPTASAAPTPADAGPAAAARLTQRLGPSATAGAYYDRAARTTYVNVTTDAAADAARTAGVVPRRVKYSADHLDTAGRSVAALGIAGTAWVGNPRTDQLVVTADARVAAADLTRLRTAAGHYGDAVRVERTTGRFATLLTGGDAVYGNGYRCSVGFNVHANGIDYLLTAGHCGKVVPYWYTDSGQSVPVGPTVGYTFPGHDYALVQYANTALAHPSAVGGQAITAAGDAYVGESVSRRGSTTGVHTGSVTGLNATVNYGNGDVVTGLTKTTVCAEPGDSGGSLYSGSTALGLTSGGSGDCVSGGTTFFQPVTGALSHYGVSIG